MTSRLDNAIASTFLKENEYNREKKLFPKGKSILKTRITKKARMLWPHSKFPYVKATIEFMRDGKYYFKSDEEHGFETFEQHPCTTNVNGQELTWYDYYKNLVMAKPHDTKKKKEDQKRKIHDRTIGDDTVSDTESSSDKSTKTSSDEEDGEMVKKEPGPKISPPIHRRKSTIPKKKIKKEPEPSDIDLKLEEELEEERDKEESDSQKGESEKEDEEEQSDIEQSEIDEKGDDKEADSEEEEDDEKKMDEKESSDEEGENIEDYDDLPDVEAPLDPLDTQPKSDDANKTFRKDPGECVMSERTALILLSSIKRFFLSSLHKQDHPHLDDWSQDDAENPSLDSPFWCNYSTIVMYDSKGVILCRLYPKRDSSHPTTAEGHAKYYDDVKSILSGPQPKVKHVKHELTWNQGIENATGSWTLLELQDGKQKIVVATSDDSHFKHPTKCNFNKYTCCDFRDVAPFQIHTKHFDTRHASGYYVAQVEDIVHNVYYYTNHKTQKQFKCFYCNQQERWIVAEFDNVGYYSEILMSVEPSNEPSQHHPRHAKEWRYVTNATPPPESFSMTPSVSPPQINRVRLIHSRSLLYSQTEKINTKSNRQLSLIISAEYDEKPEVYLRKFERNKTTYAPQKYVVGNSPGHIHLKSKGKYVTTAPKCLLKFLLSSNPMMIECLQEVIVFDVLDKTITATLHWNTNTMHFENDTLRLRYTKDLTWELESFSSKNDFQTLVSRHQQLPVVDKGFFLYGATKSSPSHYVTHARNVRAFTLNSIQFNPIDTHIVCTERYTDQSNVMTVEKKSIFDDEANVKFRWVVQDVSKKQPQLQSDLFYRTQLDFIHPIYTKFEVHKTKKDDKSVKEKIQQKIDELQSIKKNIDKLSKERKSKNGEKLKDMEAKIDLQKQDFKQKKQQLDDFIQADSHVRIDVLNARVAHFRRINPQMQSMEQPESPEKIHQKVKVLDSVKHTGEITTMTKKYTAAFFEIQKLMTMFQEAFESGTSDIKQLRESAEADAIALKKAVEATEEQRQRATNFADQTNTTQNIAVSSAEETMNMAENAKRVLLEIQRHSQAVQRNAEMILESTRAGARDAAASGDTLTRMRVSEREFEGILRDSRRARAELNRAVRFSETASANCLLAAESVVSSTDRTVAEMHRTMQYAQATQVFQRGVEQASQEIQTMNRHIQGIRNESAETYNNIRRISRLADDYENLLTENATTINALEEQISERERQSETSLLEIENARQEVARIRTEVQINGDVSLHPMSLQDATEQFEVIERQFQQKQQENDALRQLTSSLKSDSEKTKSILDDLLKTKADFQVAFPKIQSGLEQAINAANTAIMHTHQQESAVSIRFDNEKSTLDKILTSMQNEQEKLKVFVSGNYASNAQIFDIQQTITKLQNEFSTQLKASQVRQSPPKRLRPFNSQLSEPLLQLSSRQEKNNMILGSITSNEESIQNLRQSVKSINYLFRDLRKFEQEKKPDLAGADIDLDDQIQSYQIFVSEITKRIVVIQNQIGELKKEAIRLQVDNNTSIYNHESLMRIETDMDKMLETHHGIITRFLDYKNNQISDNLKNTENNLQVSTKSLRNGLHELRSYDASKQNMRIVEMQKETLMKQVEKLRDNPMPEVRFNLRKLQEISNRIHESSLLSSRFLQICDSPVSEQTDTQVQIASAIQDLMQIVSRSDKIPDSFDAQQHEIVSEDIDEAMELFTQIQELQHLDLDSMQQKLYQTAMETITKQNTKKTPQQQIAFRFSAVSAAANMLTQFFSTQNSETQLSDIPPSSDDLRYLEFTPFDKNALRLQEGTFKKSPDIYQRFIIDATRLLKEKRLNEHRKIAIKALNSELKTIQKTWRKLTSNEFDIESESTIPIGGNFCLTSLEKHIRHMIKEKESEISDHEEEMQEMIRNVIKFRKTGVPRYIRNELQKITHTILQDEQEQFQNLKTDEKRRDMRVADHSRISPEIVMFGQEQQKIHEKHTQLRKHFDKITNTEDWTTRLYEIANNERKSERSKAKFRFIKQKLEEDLLEVYRLHKTILEKFSEDTDINFEIRGLANKLYPLVKSNLEIRLKSAELQFKQLTVNESILRDEIEICKQNKPSLNFWRDKDVWNSFCRIHTYDKYTTSEWNTKRMNKHLLSKSEYWVFMETLNKTWTYKQLERFRTMSQNLEEQYVYEHTEEVESQDSMDDEKYVDPDFDQNALYQLSHPPEEDEDDSSSESYDSGDLSSISSNDSSDDTEQKVTDSTNETSITDAIANALNQLTLNVSPTEEIETDELTEESNETDSKASTDYEFDPELPRKGHSSSNQSRSTSPVHSDSEDETYGSPAARTTRQQKQKHYIEESPVAKLTKGIENNPSAAKTRDKKPKKTELQKLLESTGSNVVKDVSYYRNEIAAYEKMYNEQKSESENPQKNQQYWSKKMKRTWDEILENTNRMVNILTDEQTQSDKDSEEYFTTMREICKKEANEIGKSTERSPSRNALKQIWKDCGDKITSMQSPLLQKPKKKK